MKKIMEVREVLKEFVGEMELVLKENDYKGIDGWKTTSRYLMNKKLIEEFVEYFIIENHPKYDILSVIREIINQYHYASGHLKNTNDAKKKELVDMANICMMLHDKLK